MDFVNRRFVPRSSGVVYTFDFYQHLYNAVTFELDLGFRKVKLADYLNHQPAQVL